MIREMFKYREVPRLEGLFKEDGAPLLYRALDHLWSDGAYLR
jgi:hypothetical protein